MLEVKCLAAGAPSPTIEWSRMEEEGSGVKLIGQELRFESIKQEDAGVYQCRARNSHEKDLIARTSISVLGK